MSDLAPTSAVVIVAHPDDVEYFCGGTVAKWTSSGCSVSYVITSSGNRGSSDPREDIEQLVRTRESEQRASARLLGVNNVFFLGYPDGELSFANLNDLRKKFVWHIRKCQAEIVLTHDPDVRFARQHPDHRIVGRVAIDASFPISSVAQFYKEQIIEEDLSVCQPEFLFLFGTDEPNYWVDISDTLNLKIKALKEHQSQANAFPGGIEDRCRWKARTIGNPKGFAAAEEFLRVHLGARLPD